MQRSPQQDSQSNFEMSLRDQLIAAQNNNNNQDQPPESHPQPAAGYTAPGPTGHDEHHIDPDMGASGNQEYAMDSMNIDDAIAAMADGGRGGARKELSGSKRAAQNRAAQRAFRQRKEAYIGKLEKQVKDYRVMEEDFKNLQHENYQLREYILTLQSRILETSGDVPPPPAHINLQNPTQPGGGSSSEPRLEPIGLPPTDAESSTQSMQEPPVDQQQHQRRQSPLPEISQFRPIFDPQLHDRQAAPAADMSTRHSPVDDSISAVAVERLQAAAAEAGSEIEPKAEA
ncbi:hypothetical protein MBLNU457_4944t1 [Dothideomycetes sp. NU457]